MKKRMLSALLLLILLLSVFVSCKGDEEEIAQQTTTKFEATTTHEHVWGELVTVKRPTCIEKGLQQKSCSCGAVEDHYIDASGVHTYRDKKCIYCGMATATINSVSFEKFVIVYANDSYSKDAAENLAATIKEKQGYELSIQGESEPEAEYEILIGEISRDVCDAFFASGADYISECFDITVSGKKLAISAANKETMSAALTFFKNNFLKGPVLHITDGDGVSYNNAYSIHNKSEDGDIRLFSNNILYSSPEDREEKFFEAFDRTDADILFLQEVSVGWYDILRERLVEERGYTLVPTSTTKVDISPDNNYTPIYYKANKFRLIAYGYDQYETAKTITGNTSKSYTWAIFRDKQTNKNFCTISTHFTWAEANHSPSPDEMRQRDAEEMLKFIKSVKARYGENIPIFLMGDLNCYPGSTPYNILSRDLKAARNDNKAIVKHNIDYRTWNDVGGSVDIDSSGIIDHAFISGDGFSINKYQHIVNKTVLSASDHIPIMLDFSFVE